VVPLLYRPGEDQRQRTVWQLRKSINNGKIAKNQWGSNNYGETLAPGWIKPGISMADVGSLSGEIYFFVGGPTGCNKIVISPDYGMTGDTVTLPIGPSLYETIQLRHGPGDGELSIIGFSYLTSSYDVYHSTDYGQSLSFQSSIFSTENMVNFTAGRKPCSFYFSLKYIWDDDLEILYSSDCGVTFTHHHFILDSTFTGVNDATEPAIIRLFLNPAKDIMNIKVPEHLKILKVEVENIIGQVFLKQNLNPPGNIAAITVSGIPPGCYIAKVTTTENTTSTGKFLVNNR
jgi:hypothetical protein